MAGKAGIVVNVGPHAPGMPGTFVNLGGGYRRTVEMFTAATAALQARGQARPAAAGQPAGDVTVWTFEYQDFPAKGRVRVRVGAAGYVHAGLTRAGGRWDRVYEVPLIPAPDGAFEAVLPRGIDAFTLFWTEAPDTPGHPGHWEREDQGGRIFRRTTPRRAAGDMPPAARSEQDLAEAGNDSQLSIMLSDGEGGGERAPTRCCRYGRPTGAWCWALARRIAGLCVAC